jgi:tetratricopeptide (TPR) repeat protein
LLVEQGITGLVLLGLSLVMAIHALVRLRRSDDPLDRALAMMGWYSLLVVVITQVTDFGLLLPANAYLVVIILTLVIGRSTDVGRWQDPAGNLAHTATAKDESPRRARRMVMLSAGMLAGMAALPIQRSDAMIESVLSEGRLAFSKNQYDPDQLSYHADVIANQTRSRSSEALSVLEARYRFRIARLREIESMGCETIDDYRTAMADTRPGQRTLGSPVSPIRELYLQVVPCSLAALDRAPLSFEARAWLVYTDFAHGHGDQSIALLRQIATLQRRNPSQLIRVAETAAHRNATQVVEESGTLATSISPLFAPKAIDIALRLTDSDLDRAISDTPNSRRRATLHLLAYLDSMPERKTEIEKFIALALPQFGCSSCVDREEGAQCERLAATVCFRLGRLAEATDHYNRAIELTPANAFFHAEFIRSLIEHRQFDAARLRSAEARRLFPEDTRFLALAELIGRQERDSTQGGERQ